MVYEWDLVPSPVPTDHWLVIVKYAPKQASKIGKGRWTLLLHLTSDKKFLDRVISEGLILQRNLQNTQRNPMEREKHNSQILWKDFKESIITLAQQEMKNKEYKIDSHIKALCRDINELNNDPQASTNNDTRTNEALLTKELKYLEKRHVRNQKDALCAKITNHGETLGGIWSILNKEEKLRDYIRRLKVPNSNPPKYERNS